jgi:phosphatidylglycerophosphatase A
MSPASPVPVVDAVMTPASSNRSSSTCSWIAPPPPSGIVRLAAVFLSVIVISLGGIWAASRTEKLFGLKDPGKVVVDEVAGQLLALMPLAFLTRNPPALAVIVSFTLFRFFDIVKPYPAGRLEKLRGGFGIMCDDLVAGAYAALVLAVTVAIPGNPIY